MLNSFQKMEELISEIRPMLADDSPAKWRVLALQKEIDTLRAKLLMHLGAYKEILGQ